MSLFTVIMTYDVQSGMPTASFMAYKQSKTKTLGVETQFTLTKCASRRKTELVWKCAVTQHISSQHISAARVTTELYGGNKKV